MIITFSALAADSTELVRLREAVNAYRAGQFEKCARSARGLSAGKLLNPDSALFIEAQCLFYARRYAAARDRFTRLSKNFAASPHAVLAAYRVADCDWELRDKRSALTHYQEAEDLQPNPPDNRVDRAVGLMHQAELSIERGQRQAGLKLLNELRLRFPMHPLAGLLPEMQSGSALTLAEALPLARALLEAGRRDEALEVLDRAPQPNNDFQRYEMAFITGSILFGMAGRYQDAQRFLFAARDHALTPAQAEQAWFWGSRCYSRLGQDDQAIQSHLGMVARYPQGARAAAALFYAGWLEQNQGRCDRAQPLFEQLWQQHKRSRWAPEARWFYAWCLLRNQRWEEALGYLTTLDKSTSRASARMLYWRAYAVFSLGRSSEAEASWKSLIELYPLTWYALLARLRLGDKAPPVMPPPPPARLPALPEDPLLQKAKELVSAQAPGLAGLVLHQSEKDFLAKRPNHPARLAMFEAYRAASDIHHLWMAVGEEYGMLLRPPTAETRGIWDYAYPAYERELLTRFGGGDTTFILFLQAIMRSESGFDSLALSFANARGLMQLIPTTAERVAVELGLDPEREDLFDPEFNIRVAAWYLDRLTKKFKGQWPLIAAAYNGGPPAVMKWCALFGQLPLDAFVESIPFAETREYVKTVTETLFRYAYLEGAPLPQLMLSIDPKFIEDDVNY